MKKFILPILCAIVTGFLLGKYFFSQYEQKLDTTFSEEDTIYVLQQGVYSSQENADKYAAALSYYVVDKDDKYYRVYAAITHNKDLVDKLKEYYASKGNDIYVREIKINNQQFLELIKQYDLVLESSSTNEELLQIEKQVLSMYKELVLKNE